MDRLDLRSRDGLTQVSKDGNRSEGVSTDDDQDGEDGLHSEPHDCKVQELGLGDDFRRLTAAQDYHLAALAHHRIEIEKTRQSRPAHLAVRTRIKETFAVRSQFFAALRIAVLLARDLETFDRNVESNHPGFSFQRVNEEFPILFISLFSSLVPLMTLTPWKKSRRP